MSSNINAYLIVTRLKVLKVAEPDEQSVLFKQVHWFMRNCGQKIEFNWHSRLGAVT